MSEVRVFAPADTDRQQTVSSRTKGEIVPAEADRLVELASYQEGSVVSRVLIRRSTGTVSLFAFDEGQELSEHTAPFDALVHVLEGEAEIVIAGKKVNIVRISSLQTAEDCGHLASWAASQPVTRGATSSNVSSGETN